MSKKKLSDVLWGVLIGAAIMTVYVLILFTLVPAKRTTEATQYDLDCLTEDIKANPLMECKE